MVQATFARVVNADFADGVRAHLCDGIGDFLLARSPRIQTHTEVSCVFNQIFLCKLLFIRIHVGIPNPFLGVWMLRVDQLLLQLLMLPQLVSGLHPISIFYYKGDKQSYVQIMQNHFPQTCKLFQQV
jgi:hypothetical protein